MMNAYYRVTLSNQQRNLCLSFDYVECADLVRHRSGILSASLYVSLFRQNTTTAVIKQRYRNRETR